MREKLMLIRSVHLLPFADHIIALNDEGRIVEQGSFSTLNANLDHTQSRLPRKPQRSMSRVSKSASNNARPAAVVDDPIPMIDRRTGDMTVYKYYMDTCEWWKWVILMALAVSYGFFTIFPSKCLPGSQP